MFKKVNAGHPDKMADRLAGAVVDLVYERARADEGEPPRDCGVSQRAKKNTNLTNSTNYGFPDIRFNKDAVPN